jgi:hypothetical protein
MYAKWFLNLKVVSGVSRNMRLLTCFTGEENGRWETSIGVVPGRSVSCPAVQFEDETEEAGDHCNASPHPEESLQIGFYHQNVCENS